MNLVRKFIRKNQVNYRDIHVANEVRLSVSLDVDVFSLFLQELSQTSQASSVQSQRQIIAAEEDEFNSDEDMQNKVTAHSFRNYQREVTNKYNAQFCMSFNIFFFYLDDIFLNLYFLRMSHKHCTCILIYEICNKAFYCTKTYILIVYVQILNY